MMNNATMKKLDQLKLFGMANEFDQQLNAASYAGLSFEERFGMIVDRETTFRDDKRLKRLLSLAHLRETACMEDIRYSTSRGFEQSQMASMRTGSWITSKLNAIFTGPTGSGKTWLACALGHQACCLGKRTHYQRIPLLLETLGTGHIDRTFNSQIKALGKWELLILDDLGLKPLKAENRSDLFEVIEARHNNASTILISQLPTADWHKWLAGAGPGVPGEGASGNPTIADAFLDRVLSRAVKFDLKGKSMRTGSDGKPDE